MRTNTTPIQFGAVRRRGFRGPAVRLLRSQRTRGFLFFAAGMASFLCSGSFSFAGDRWETLQAIHLIENPTNSLRVGRNGELGPYQFRPSTWNMHTTKPFRLAADREEADRVAVKHYDWICRGLERKGVEATPYRIALAWNAGLTATLRNAAPLSSHDYAARVQRIAADLRRRQVVGQ